MDANIEEKQAAVRAGSIRKNSPASRHGFDLGDPVRLPCMSTTFQIVGLSDPSLVDLQAPDGRIVRAGWRTLIRIPVNREQT